MKVTQFTKRSLAVRRENRDMKNERWERRHLHGGVSGWNNEIKEVKIALGGRDLWVKIGKA